MPTILSQLDSHFRAAIQKALGIDADPQLGVSQNENFGDYQSNAAMSLAKTAKANPRATAEKIKAALDLVDIASEVSIAGPGFINVRLSPAFLAKELESRRTDEGPVASQTVVVDYSGPNVAKEMHVGHLRSTIIGDAIVRILAFKGNKIVRQNHIGDWGTQFGMLITHLQSSSTSNQQSRQISDLEGFYRAAKERFDAEPDFAEAARQTVVRLQAGRPEEKEYWQKIVDETRLSYQPLYDRLSVLLRREDERGESSYNQDLAGVVDELIAAGVAVESEHAIVVPVPGFESPLIIRKSDGGYLYGTTDLAAIRYRVRVLHANRIIYVHDSRQQQHFAQVFYAAKKAGWAGGVQLEYAPFGTMLGADGKPFKTRSGGTVKLKELLDEAEERALKVVTEKNPELSDEHKKRIAHAVGIAGVKYSDLSKDRISDYVFSFDKMLALDGNTAPYLQYAHARIRSIFRKTDEQGGPIHLESPFELALAKHILRLGEIIDLVARELKPHHLCTYLYELASRFSGFYENCPVLQSEEKVRHSRLALCDLTAQTMARGLDLLGIEHPDQM